MSTLIVIAKECLPGKAKTRLTPPLTGEQAAHLAATSLRLTLETAGAYDGVHHILYFDGDPTSLWADLPHLKNRFEVIPQVDGDLDVRLGYIFDLVRQRYGCNERTALIGMDTPQVSNRLLHEVFEDPTATPTWLGPTDDGGYWLIGMQEPDGDMIRGVPMSQEDTFEHQYNQLQTGGAQPRLLSQLLDMDHWEDAISIRNLIPDSAFAAEVDTVRDSLTV